MRDGLLGMLVVLLGIAVLAAGQEPLPPRVLPPVVEEGRVKFVVEAPAAAEVQFVPEGRWPLAMQPDQEGRWVYVVQGMEPGFHTYQFIVDGQQVAEEALPHRRTIDGHIRNVLHIPGPPELPWEETDVPRGHVRTHVYRSTIAGEERSLIVYLPPQYDVGERDYPVLYLLHGVTDDASAWITAGRVNVMMDNLVARGEVVPMIIVMPLGYGFPDPAANLRQAFAGPEGQLPIMRSLAEMVLTEIIPLAEREYRTAPGREHRAIAGLSMGGSQAVYLGLNHPEEFAWIGAFSGAFMMYGNMHDQFLTRAIDGVDPPPRLFWRSVGTEDFVLPSNRLLGRWLEERGIESVAEETPGGHTWGVFRRAFCQFAARLFKDEPTPDPS